MPTPTLHTLTDGRNLAYYEFGDPLGTPSFFIPGLPASGLAGEAFDAAAREAGVRLISVDKPGYGHSSLHPAGTLASFGRDLGVVANSLGLKEFGVIGESGGGPYALAAAHELAGHVTVLVVLVGMGPGHEKWAREGMKPVNRTLLLAARRAPFLLRPMYSVLGRQFNDDAKIAKRDAADTEHLPAADAAVMAETKAIDIAAIRDSLRQGVGGAVNESKLLARPWGFALGDIKVPVEIWHGTADVNVPIALARHVADRIPGSTLHVLDGVGHAAGRVASGDVMAVVARAGSVRRTS